MKFQIPADSVARAAQSALPYLTEAFEKAELARDLKEHEEVSKIAAQYDWFRFRPIGTEKAKRIF